MDYTQMDKAQLLVLQKLGSDLIDTCEEGERTCRKAVKFSKWMSRAWIVYGLLMGGLVIYSAAQDKGWSALTYLACLIFAGSQLWLERERRGPHWRERLEHWEGEVARYREDHGQVTLALMEKDIDGEMV